MATKAKIRANNKYRKEHVKSIALSFYPKDYELYEYVKSKGNMSGFLRGLAEEAMRKEQSEQER